MSNSISDLTPEEKRALLRKMLEQRASKPVSYPASVAQERMWILSQLDPSGFAYNISTAVSLHGALDVPALERSVNHIVARHQALRTNFSMEGEIPVQIVTPVRTLKLPVVDVSHLPESDRAQEAERLATEEIQQVFNLGEDLLIRAKLLRLGESEHVFLVTIHHSVADGWSLFVTFINELVLLYNADVRREPFPLPPLLLQYPEFAVWQREWLKRDTIKEQLTYWRRQLEGVHQIPELPLDHPRPTTSTYRRSTLSRVLPGSLSEAVRRLSRTEGATLFMTLLTAYKVLLSRYVGEEDIIVGTPISGRSRPGTEQLIGMFLNTLALRTDLTGSADFREALHRVKHTALGAYACQDVPFEEVIRAVQPGKGYSQAPLFRVFFNMINFSAGRLELHGLTAEILPPASVGPPFDVELYCSEHDGTIHLLLVYDAHLFTTERMEEMLEQYELLLEQAVANPGAPVRTYSLVTAGAASRLPGPARPIEEAWYGAVQERFAEVAHRSPERVALVDRNGSVRYGDLEARANQLAHYLQGLGIGSGDLVAVYAQRSAALVWALLGVLKAGAAFLVLDPAYPPTRLLTYLRLAQPKSLLHLEEAGALPDELEHYVTENTGVSALVLPPVQRAGECLALRTCSSEAVVLSTHPEDTAYIAFTSGSTGEPKGIVGTHGPLSHFMHWQCTTFGLRQDDRFTLLSGLAHDPLLRDVCTPLWLGATLCIPDPEDIRMPRRLAAWMQQERITVTHLTPAMGQLLAEAEQTRLETLRYAFFGGDVLRQRHTSTLRAMAPSATCVNFYGATETPQAMAYYTAPVVHGTDTDSCVTGAGRAALPLGRGIEGAQLLILNETGQQTGVGELGEIYIRTPYLSRGYLKDEALTRTRFLVNPFTGAVQDRLYRTGDLGRYLPDGNVMFAGRADLQVNIRGFRIELGEVEAALHTHPAVAQAVVTAHAEASGEQSLVAYLVPAGDTLPARSDLAGYLKQRLPDAMVPSLFMELPSLPLTPNGKVDRKALPEPDLTRKDQNSYVAARTFVEEALVEIWQQVLRLEPIGIDDNFFELGGHSLLATQVVSRIRNVLGPDVPLRVLFDAPTVRGMAAQVEGLWRHTVHLPPLHPYERPAGRAPLSFSQERMWFLYQFAPESTAYNMAGAMRLQGPLDVDAMEAALNELVARHEGLRTRFVTEDRQPVQVVDPPRLLTLRTVDLTAFPQQEREQRLLSLAREEVQQPFDLEQGPLLRPFLFRLDEQEHLLLTVIHHIISDQWSMGIMGRELGVLYRSKRTGTPPSLPPLPVSYLDFSLWQRNWLQGERLEALVGYWKHQLQGTPPLELPTDHKRPAVLGSKGAQVTDLIPVPIMEGLKKLGTQERATLSMVLLACFNVLLNRYSGQEDISVAMPVANRNHSEIEHLVGTFINTLVLRTDLSENPTFRTLLQRVRQVKLGAVENQDLPFAKLVNELQPERDPSRSPLAQVLFNVQNAPAHGIEFGGLTWAPFVFDRGSAQFDLTLNVETEIEGRATLVYNTDLFTAPTAARMMRHFVGLLEAAVATPDAPIATLPLLTDAERHQMLVAWNDTATAFPHTQRVDELVSAQARRTPDALALSDAFGHHLSYADLERRANQLAHHLRRAGLRPGTTVGLCLERSVDMVVGLLGILKAGAAYVPMDPAFPAHRLALMVDEAEMPVLITEAAVETTLRANPDLAQALAAHSTRVLRLDTDGAAIAQAPQTPPADGAAPDDLAYVIFTSGSTGRPKGVMIEHRALTNFLCSMQQRPGLRADDVLVSVTTLSFDIAALELYLPLITGARVVIASREQAADGAELAALLGREGGTVLQATPVTWRLLLEAGWRGGPELRMLCGGEALPAALAAELVATGGALWNLYGPTETTIWSSVERIPLEEALITIGRPIANTELYVLDGHRAPVPVGVTGTLYIGGAGLARGYLKRAELTAEKFIAHPFKAGERLYETGDLARYRPDGRLECLGRVDHQVKVRGYRIELGEIEAALESHEQVGQAVVVTREEGASGFKHLVAYVTGKGETSLATGELRAYLKGRLPEYMVPAWFVELEAFPQTPNGKVDRKALPEPEGDGLEPGTTYEEPRTETEVELVRIWGELLGRERIGIHDNFFELGGHSLLAVRLNGLVQERFTLEISLPDLFEAPTVADLAVLIAQKRSREMDEDRLLELLAELDEVLPDQVQAALHIGS